MEPALQENESFLQLQSLEFTRNISENGMDSSALGAMSINDFVAPKVQKLNAIQDSIMNISPCLYASQNAIFDLHDVCANDGCSVSTTDEQQINSLIGGGTTVMFNFCEQKFNEDNMPANCKDKPQAFAYAWLNSDPTSCQPVLASSDADPNTQAQDIYEGNTENVNGVKLVFESDDKDGYECPSDSNKKLKLSVELMCSDDEVLQVVSDPVTMDPCDIYLEYKSKKGCTAFQYGTLAMFMQKYSYLLGAIFIVFGLLLAFCGNKFVTFVVGLVSATATLVLGLYLTTVILDNVLAVDKIEQYVIWIILGVWVVIGIIVGVLVAKKRKWAVSLIAAFGGVMLGLLLTTIFGPALTSAALYYVIIIGCGIVAFIIAFCVEKFVLIVITSFIGSYAIVRGISMYAGGFPNETELHSMAKAGYIDWSSFPKAFYGYLAGIVVLSVLTSVFQWKNNKDEDKTFDKSTRSRKHY